MLQVPSLIFLDLSGNYLQGTLPPAFATALPRLLGLFLGSNALTGTLPPEWAALSSLSLLNLGDNNLSGKLPPAWGAWPNIRDLRLAANQLSSTLPPEYGSWTDIEELELGMLSASALNGLPLVRPALIHAPVHPSICRSHLVNRSSRETHCMYLLIE